MGDADYIIAWPDVSGSSANWTLSHRVPGHSSHDMPQLASSAAGTDTQSYYQLVPSLALRSTTRYVVLLSERGVFSRG